MLSFPLQIYMLSHNPCADIIPQDRACTIHAIYPGLSGTVLDFDSLSQYPRKFEIVPEIKEKDSTDFLRSIEGEGFVIHR